MLGLVQNWGGERIDADYEVPSDQVFWKTSITLIKNTNSLDVLNGTIGPRTTARMGRGRPSWVSDWSHPSDVYETQRLANIRFYNASENSPRTSVKLHGKSILEIGGFAVDRIAVVASELPLAEDGDPRRWRAVVAEWERALEPMRVSRRGSYIGGGTISNAFWRTLCGDLEHRRDLQSGHTEWHRTSDARRYTYQDWRSEDTATRRRTSIIAGYLQESAGPSNPETADRNAFHHAVECASGWRRFFITERGYIGSGPRDTAAGDSIFIVPGVRVPFIFRNSPAMYYCRDDAIEELIRESQETFLQKAFQNAQKGAKEPNKERLRKAAKDRSRQSLSEGDPSEAVKSTCKEAHGHCYTVVGDAYVHQLMDGQFHFLVGGIPSPTPTYLI